MLVHDLHNLLDLDRATFYQRTVKLGLQRLDLGTKAGDGLIHKRRFLYRNVIVCGLRHCLWRATEEKPYFHDQGRSNTTFCLTKMLKRVPWDVVMVGWMFK